MYREDVIGELTQMIALLKQKHDETQPFKHAERQRISIRIDALKTALAVVKNSTEKQMRFARAKDEVEANEVLIAQYKLFETEE